MRLLLTTDTIGGVWTYTKELTLGLLQHGSSVAMVSFGGRASREQSRWASELMQVSGDRFRYIPSAIPLEWMEENARSFLEGAALLKHVIEEFQPHLLHSNQFCYGKLDLDIPRLVVAHSDVLSWADACVPGGLEGGTWLSRYVQLVQDGLDGATAVAAPTEWMLQALAQHFALPAAQHVITNGRTLLPADSCSPRTLQAVSAGRLWDPAKHLASLNQIQAMPVLIAGSLQQDALQTGGGSTLNHVGFLSETELFTLFRRSSVYIAASIYEPFGLAPLEAALCGCAIVANDLPSLREVWGSAALYFRNPSELEDHLEKLRDNQFLLASKQAASLLRAQRYKRETMTSHYLGLYERLLAGSMVAEIAATRLGAHAL